MIRPFTADVTAKLAVLQADLAGRGRLIVAFSGGVDSAVLLAVAAELNGRDVLAVTADSPSIPRRELAAARAFATALRIPHRVLATAELADENYVRNDAQRCYHCKSELYDSLQDLARREGFDAVVDGTQCDDMRGVRPGLRAAAERGVASPFVAAGIGKADVRALARRYAPAVAEKPSAPCLASRIAFGQRITDERLSRVERAEALLSAELGACDLRVRDHGAMARIEVPAVLLPALAEPARAARVAAALKALGFAYVTLDLEGFRSGSMHAAVAAGASP